MPRGPVDLDKQRSVERELASRRLRASLPPPSKQKRRTWGYHAIAAFKAETEEMISSSDFTRAGPRHLVAVWSWCHEKTYGVAPAMTGKEWGLASLAAGGLLKSDFDGKVERLVAFLKWSWAEERRSVKWRKENGKPITPLGWRLQFSKRHVVKWRTNGGG
jgi:hypothetical protein